MAATTESQSRGRCAGAPAPVLVVITGDPGAGKTTLCTAAVQHASRRGLRVGGLLSLPHHCSGGRLRRRVLDIASGEWRVLGHLHHHACDHSPSLQSKAGGSSQAAGPITLAWELRPDSMRWADDRLARCVTAPPDVLVVDEIGRLELMEGRGWGSAVPLLASGNFGLGIAVVRPWLLATFRERLGPGAAIRTLEVGVDASSRAVALGALLRLLDEVDTGREPRSPNAIVKED